MSKIIERLSEIRQVLRNIEFNDWRLCLNLYSGSGLCLTVQAQDKCNQTGRNMSWSGRKWHISEQMTDNEIINTAFKAVMTAVEHETREQFKYKGEMVMSGHMDYNQLADEMKAHRNKKFDMRENHFAPRG